MKYLDFLDQLRLAILQIPAPSPILPKDVYLGNMVESPCVSITPLPGGDEMVFMDGARDKEYNISVLVQHQSDGACNTYLTDLYRHIERVKDVPSNNTSYEFIRAKTSNLPSKQGIADKNLNVWEVNFKITIHIYKGVDE